MCRNPESPPTAFYAPINMFTNADLEILGATYLGDRIRYGGSYFTIATAPLCRLYWNSDGMAEPDSIESRWTLNSDNKWIKQGNNYVSYQLTNGDFVTPRSFHRGTT